MYINEHQFRTVEELIMVKDPVTGEDVEVKYVNLKLKEGYNYIPLYIVNSISMLISLVTIAFYIKQRCKRYIESKKE
jgi:uncharacterized protein with PQ loop repeat